MESMGIIGFIFGLSGLSFALMSREQLTALKKEFDELKKNLEDSELLKEK
jgi:hypothetical protein